MPNSGSTQTLRCRRSADTHLSSLLAGDDVGGFEAPEASLTGGGIQTTGNYPGKARNIDELPRDIEKALPLVPALGRLLGGDASIPAGRVRRQSALVIADHTAAEEL